MSSVNDVILSWMALQKEFVIHHTIKIYQELRVSGKCVCGANLTLENKAWCSQVSQKAECEIYQGAFNYLKRQQQERKQPVKEFADEVYQVSLVSII